MSLTTEGNAKEQFITSHDSVPSAFRKEILNERLYYKQGFTGQNEYLRGVGVQLLITLKA